MSQEDIKKLQDDLAKAQEEAKAAQEEAKRVGDEKAAALAALHEEYRSGKSPVPEIPGEVKLSLIPTDGGNATKATYGIKPGHPYVRTTPDVVVSTSALMKLAMGQKLTDEELAKNAGLKDWEKKDAIDFLTKNAAIGAGWLVAK